MKADGKNTLMRVGGNADVVECFVSCYDRFKDQPNDIVQDLFGLTTKEACESVFDYMCSHVQYKLDPDGQQFIKSPARLIADGCGDCKSLTMFVACCLHCLHIPCKVRFVNFDGGSQFTHVYPVAIDESGHEIVLDMCETTDDGTPYIDYARPYQKKKDIYYGK